MADDKQQPGWKDRNVALKTYKHTGKYGWMHLVIGQNKITKRKFLRLKRYMNWFSIPNPEALSAIFDSLKSGASELGWTVKEGEPIQLVECDSDSILDAGEKGVSSVPDDVIDFVEENPEFVKQVLALDIGNKDAGYFFEVLELIHEAVSKSGDRFKYAFKEVVEKLSKEKSKGIQDLSDLMQKWNLFQITSLANVLKGRLDTINTFEELIHDNNTYEINGDNSIHRILEKNMWLIDENYWLVQSNKSLRTFIGDEIMGKNAKESKKRPDFACVNPSDNKLIIVEIKRPAVKLKKDELDQAELYQRIIKKYKGKSYSAIEIFLVGNKISDEAREIVQMRRGVQIRTYSDFLENCRKRYQDYLKIVEKS